jgi:hypothetical protein
MTLWKIIIPLISPGIVSTGIICGTLNYNEFLFAFFFTSNPTRILPIGVARKPGPEGPCPKGAGGLSPGLSQGFNPGNCHPRAMRPEGAADRRTNNAKVGPIVARFNYALLFCSNRCELLSGQPLAPSASPTRRTGCYSWNAHSCAL